MALNVFDMTARLGLDTSEYKRGMKSAKSDTNTFANMLKANLAAMGIKSVADALMKLGETVINFGKEVLNSYAQYEQLVGGVETLFGNAADEVKKYADEAYKTAGLSANQYMETVTSFSASLIQSVGGDTKKAAKLADMAITDMADNANKMGTQMEAIQNAYSGFAKQNYTMLDNLKLGYGGTKSEMDRLIKDAAKMDKTFKYNTKTVIKNKKQVQELDYTYADIVQAIHIVQDNMKITGTTAKEASDTIEGSLNSTKAAWQNLMVAVGKGSADEIREGIANLSESAGNYVSNVGKVIKNILSNIGVMAINLLVELAKQIPGIAMDLFTGVVTGIYNTVKEIIRTVYNLIGEAVKALFGEDVWNEIDSFVTGIIQSIQSVIDYIAGIMNKIGSVVVNHFSGIWDRFVSIFGAVYNWLDANIATPVKKFWSEKIQPIINEVAEAFEPVKKSFQVLLDTIVRFFNGEQSLGDIGYVVKDITDKLLGFLDTVVPGFKDFHETVLKPLGSFLKVTFTQAWEGIKTFFEETIPAAIATVAEKFTGFKDGALSNVGSFVTDTLNAAWNALVTLFTVTIPEAIGVIQDAFVVFRDGPMSEFVEFVKIIFNGAWKALVAIFTVAIPNAIATLQGIFKAFWDEIITPLATFLKDTFLAAWQEIKRYWAEELKPGLDELWTAFGSFWNETLVPLIDFLQAAFTDAWNAVVELFGGENDGVGGSVNKLAKIFKNIWQKVLQPVARYLAGAFSDAWDTVKTLLNGFITFLTKAFKGDWEGAWNAIVDIFGTLWGKIEEKAKKPINKIIDLVNGLIGKIRDGLNTIIDFINDHLKIEIPSFMINPPDWLAWTGAQPFGFPGYSWSPGINRIDWSDNAIKRFATGGILRNGQQAIVGEYEPEYLRVRNGQAIVTPMNTGRFGGGNTTNITIYQQPGENAEELATRIDRILTRREQKRRAVYGT